MTTIVSPHAFYDMLPLDVMRLIVQFLFKSTEFHHVMRFLRVSKRMMELLDIGWMKRLYDHEWYLYQRRRLSKEGWYAQDELQCLKRKRDVFGFRRITPGKPCEKTLRGIRLCVGGTERGTEPVEVEQNQWVEQTHKK
jgi:hypothetical protein